MNVHMVWYILFFRDGHSDHAQGQEATVGTRERSSWGEEANLDVVSNPWYDTMTSGPDIRSDLTSSILRINLVMLRTACHALGTVRLHLTVKRFPPSLFASRPSYPAAFRVQQNPKIISIQSSYHVAGD